MMKFRQLLKNRDITYFLLADLFTSFGNGLIVVGSGWFIIEQTNLNIYVAYLMIAFNLGGLLIFPIGGIITDRFDKRLVLLVCNLIRGLVMVVASWFYHYSNPGIQLVLAISFITGVSWGIKIPATKSIIQGLLNETDYPSGNALFEISTQVGMLSAAGSVGYILRYLSFSGVVLLSSCTFLFSCIYLLAVRHRLQRQTDQTFLFFADLKAGIGYLKNSPAVLVFGFVVFIPTIAPFIINIILPGYVLHYLQFDAVVFGIADMSYGIGAFAAGLGSAYVIEKLNQKALLNLTFVFSVVVCLYFTLNDTIAGLVIACFCLGLGNIILRVFLNSIILSVVSPDYIGRALSFWFGAIMLVELGISVLIGKSADQTSVKTGFYWLSGLFLVGLIGCVILLPFLKQKTDKSTRLIRN